MKNLLSVLITLLLVNSSACFGENKPLARPTLSSQTQEEYKKEKPYEEKNITREHKIDTKGKAKDKLYNRSNERPLKIVVSFSIIKNLTKHIIGNVKNIELINIIPEETDPHCYQLTPSNLKILSNADLVLLNGLNFEISLERAIECAGYQGKIIFLHKNIKERTEINDPHIWHNVMNAIQYAKNIKDTLIHLDKVNENNYERNFQNLKQNLENLHEWIKAQYKDIPKEKRNVVTTHDAFWYYGQAYGINFISPIGVSTEEEPSPKNIVKVIRFIKDHNIKAIFFPKQGNTKQLQQIIEETNMPAWGELFDDFLSHEGGKAPDYISMMTYNTNLIIKALKS